jgi:hypothetical protein
MKDIFFWKLFSRESRVKIETHLLLGFMLVQTLSHPCPSSRSTTWWRTWRTSWPNWPRYGGELCHKTR